MVDSIEQKPEWIVLHREMFPQTSIGSALFPEVLEGRKRPQTTFNQSLQFLWPEKRVILSELRDQIGLNTIADILFLSSDQLSSLPPGFQVRERVGEYLEGLAITPQARLISRVFDKPQIPVPIDREREVIAAVDDRLATLTEREQKVLRPRFGTEDGIRNTLEGVGKSFGVTGERIRQIEERGFRKLRHPSRSKFLEGHATFPQDSLARSVFGAVFDKDMPRLGVSVQELNLSSDVLNEVDRISTSSWPNGDTRLIELDLKDVDLSLKALYEITERLLRVYEQRRMEDIQALEDKSMSSVREKLTPTVNNLIPEIPLPVEQLSQLAEQHIGELNLSVRARNALTRRRIRTVGELLKLTKYDLTNIPGLGKKGFIDVGWGIQNLLALPEEQYPEDFVAKLLTPN